MKFSLGWIREFVDVSEEPGRIARRLTAAGLPVETTAEGPGGDTIFDIEIFSNRPDCMNVYGVAREVAASTRRGLCPYPSDLSESDAAPAASGLASVRIEDADLCGRYVARLVQQVSVGPSPEWLARRLVSVGLRPVNNVVDVTNYVLWEIGHPLHAFDHAALRGGAIRVRRARKGESIVTLDGTRRELAPEILVIADAERPVAIAGVMGGAETMVTERTTAVLLESAWFDPVSVRRTSKRLALSTDASYRFERGADIEAAHVAINRAAALIAQVAGGRVCRGLLEDRPRPPARRRLGLRPARVATLLGATVDPAAIEGALARLQFIVHRREDRLEVEVPSHRQDIEREVDLVEEVARSIGYDEIPERLPTIAGSGGIRRAGHARESVIRGALRAAGCSEAMTTSFASPAVDWALRQRLDPREPAIEPIALSNPIAADQEILRSTLLPGLLASVSHNLNRGNGDLRIYEIGRTFRRGAAGPPSHEDRKHAPVGPVEEHVTLGVAITGNARPAHWSEPPRETTFYDLKGLVESVLAEAGAVVRVAPMNGSQALDPARSCLLLVEGEAGSAPRPIGRLGALNGAWRERLELRQEVFVAEVSLGDLFSMQAPPVAFRPLPRFPSVTRDLSLVVEKGRPFAELERAALEAAGGLAVSVSVFDRYLGKGLPPGTEGLSISIVYQDPGRTLSAPEVADLQARVIESLGTRCGARLRQ